MDGFNHKQFDCIFYAYLNDVINAVLAFEDRLIDNIEAINLKNNK